MTLKVLIAHKLATSPGLLQNGEEVFVTSACCGWALELEVNPAYYRCVSCGNTAPARYDDGADLLRPNYNLSWTRRPAGNDGFVEWLEEWFEELEGCEVSVEF